MGGFAIVVLFRVATLVIMSNSALSQKLCSHPSVPLADCKAPWSRYKCAAFFVDLPRQPKLVHIEGLPDIMNGTKYTEEVKRSLKTMKYSDFYIGPDKCQKSGDKLANARCYLALYDLAKKGLDSCDASIVSQTKGKTAGDLLCQRIDQIYDGTVPTSELRDVEIGFGYSACMGSWTRVTSRRSGAYGVKEKLCCRKMGRDYKFFRCDGTSYKSQCN